MEKTSFQLGHILIKVDDLEEAAENYAKLGFQVVAGVARSPGSKKPVNYKIPFGDSSFLELYHVAGSSVLSAITKLMYRFGNIYARRQRYYLNSPKGLNDYALDSEPDVQYETNLAILKKQKFDLYGPIRMKRNSMSGVDMKWQIYCVDDTALPFIMSPYSPPFRPTKEETAHSNGSVHVSSIHIETAHWDTHYSQYEKLLSQSPEIKDESHSKESSFHFGKTTLFLKESNQDKICQIGLASKKVTGNTQLDIQQTGGVSIVLEPYLM